MPPQRNENSELVESVASFLDERRLLPPRAAVVAGVSGGADSVAMLSVLRELAQRPARSYRLTVAHLNHLIRPGAEDDAKFVADLAARWRLPCVVERRDVPAEARRRSAALEQTAREVRYEFLRRTAETAGAGYVAVAHHADDNVETVLHRIIRGTHIRGLCGMPARRPLGRSSVLLVRPLLGVHRDQVEAYLRAAGLEWRTDPTNADTRFTRNFIRLELLPLLRDRLNARADEAILRLASAAGQVESYLGAQADRALQDALRELSDERIVLDADRLAAEGPILRAYAMRGALERMGVPLRTVDFARFAELAHLAEGPVGGFLALGGGFVARREGPRIVIERGQAGAGKGMPAVAMECPGETMLPDGRRIACRIEPMDRADFEEHCGGHRPGEELLDADRVRGALICRARKAGDSLVPLGCSGRQSVSDFLTNLKLPRQRRAEVLCICDELGIVYVAPLRIDDRVKVTGQTRRILRITIVEPQPGIR